MHARWTQVTGSNEVGGTWGRMVDWGPVIPGTNVHKLHRVQWETA